MDHSLLVIIASLATGGCVFLVVWLIGLGVVRAREEAAHLSAQAVETSSLWLRLVRPIARWAGYLLGAVFARLEMRLGRDSSRSFLLSARMHAARGLMAAGRPENLSADEFLGLIGVAALGGLAVGLLFYVRVPLGIVPIATTCLAGLWPIFWLRGRIRERQAGMRRLLPYALDLLTLSVEAGLDFTESLARIVKRLGTAPLAVEMGETLRQIQLGKSRAEALRDLARRVDLSELRSVVSALIQTDALGGNLGPALRAQAQQLRNARSQHAEKLAMEAPVKILFPLILFIFPCMFIVIFGPIIIQVFFRGGG